MGVPACRRLSLTTPDLPPHHPLHPTISQQLLLPFSAYQWSQAPLTMPARHPHAVSLLDQRRNPFPHPHPLLAIDAAYNDPLARLR